MNVRKPTLILVFSFTCLLGSVAQDAHFFRVVGPVPVTITAVRADGYVTWTNQPTNATFTVQTVASLSSATNWMDWVQVPLTNAVTTHRVFDPNPPAGMAFIPAGTFTMGNCMAANEARSDELPLHTVYISACYLDAYEVTQALWDDVYKWATNHGYSFAYTGAGKAANHPVQTINWYDMAKWCNARSEKQELMPCYYTGATQTTPYRIGSLDLTKECVRWTANGYRLPTEAEWEKAARGGTSGHRFPWNDTDNISHGRANYFSSGAYSYDISPTRGNHPAFNDDPVPYTSPVGYFAPNTYGLYDMAGNVWEWTWDWLDLSWYGKPEAAQIDSRGPSTPPPYAHYRVLRGGGWSSHLGNFDAFTIRSACRAFSDYALNEASSLIGFRCVRGH